MFNGRMNAFLSKFERTDTEIALIKRSLGLFVNFFLIILAYYQVKTASKSLLIEFAGAAWFPYVWIYSALTLTVLIGFYHRIVARFRRVRVVFSSLIIFALCLVGFRYLIQHGSTATAIAFYIFVDIFSVILVEQFWSLTVSISDTGEGKKSFWFVGTGGLAGGLCGGLLAGFLVKNTALNTPDLLYVCAALLLATLVHNILMWRKGMFEELPDQPSSGAVRIDWSALLSNRYIVLIAALLCLSQLVQALVEFQFVSIIEREYTELAERTVFIGWFLAMMGVFSIAVNLLITPLIHRYFGIFAGLLIQPVVIASCSFVFFFHATLTSVSIMKLSDRGLSYSINRASKELLYIPIDPVQTYQVKAWIDMLGYRLFKVLGSGLIILATQYLPVSLDVGELSLLTVCICGVWLVFIGVLSASYRRIVLRV